CIHELSESCTLNCSTCFLKLISANKTCGVGFLIFSVLRFIGEALAIRSQFEFSIFELCSSSKAIWGGEFLTALIVRTSYIGRKRKPPTEFDHKKLPAINANGRSRLSRIPCNVH